MCQTLSVYDNISNYTGVATTTAYDAFGTQRGEADTTPSRLSYRRYLDGVGFGGQWGYEGNVYTRLHHLGARYYDTTAGRFVTRDPIGYKGGINLYGFTGNNPVNEQDPSGLDPNDPTDPDFGRDIDIHPGMHKGTPRSNMARQMTRDTISTLGSAALGTLGIEERVVGRTAEAIQAARMARVEANAARVLLDSERATGGHFLSKHGAQTTLGEQLERATTGITPNGSRERATDSSRFFSNQIQLNAMQRAETIYRQTGESNFSFAYGSPVGEGFLRGGRQYQTSSKVTAVFRNGKLRTLYPKLK